MTVELLQKFCSEDRHRVGSIGRPWTTILYTYATDGRIIVRVSNTQCPTAANDSAPKQEKIDKIAPWNHSEITEWIPIPEVPPSNAVECKTCDGFREHTCECGHVHECEECEGRGDFLIAIPVSIGAAQISNDYLRKIKQLPNPLIENTKEEHSAVAFKFDGGVGYIMPMRTDKAEKAT